MRMVRLPSPLERRLVEAFPRMRDREQFVVEALEQALDELPEQQIAFEGGEESIGGTLHLFTDGGSRGNPGEAAIAYIIEDPTQGVTLKQHGERIGVETNNVAEYQALLHGLRAAEHFHPNRLVCHMDSELIVRQMNGQYQVKMPALQELNDAVRAVTMRFPDVVFKHIPRSDNYRADALVNKALDAIGPSHFKKPGQNPMADSKPIQPLRPEDRFPRF